MSDGAPDPGSDLSFEVTDGATGRSIRRVLRLDWRRASARDVWLERSFDKTNDWYHERIFDPDQLDPIHEVAHPLSLHRGRGADASERPFADLVERGLELVSEVRGARGGYIWHVEVWRDEPGAALRTVIRDSGGADLPGVPANALGLMQVHDAGQGRCDQCASLAFHLSRRGTALERYCFDHLFRGG